MKACLQFTARMHPISRITRHFAQFLALVCAALGLYVARCAKVTRNGTDLSMNCVPSGDDERGGNVPAVAVWLSRQPTYAVAAAR